MSPAAAIEQGITVFADQPFAAAGQSGQFVDVVVGILSAVMAGGDIHPPVAIEIPGGDDPRAGSFLRGVEELDVGSAEISEEHSGPPTVRETPGSWPWRCCRRSRRSRGTARGDAVAPGVGPAPSWHRRIGRRTRSAPRGCNAPPVPCCQGSCSPCSGPSHRYGWCRGRG